MILTMRKRNRQMTRKKCFISRFDFIILCRIICRFILYYAINKSYVVLNRKVPSSPGGATCWTSLLLPPQLLHSMQPWTPGNYFFKFFSLIIDNITLDPDQIGLKFWIRIQSQCTNVWIGPTIKRSIIREMDFSLHRVV